MADVLETRSVSDTFDGSEHLLRVACIGDSMMYGEGVPAREALPAQLSRLMNAALIGDLVWVDNFGESSGNIWHAWTQLKSRARRMRFDAIVFSVCQNDIAAFESNTVRYDDSAYVGLWTEAGRINRGARDLFADVKHYCDAHDILPIVIFYTLLDEDRPIIEWLARTCAGLGLTFVDLLSFFGELTGITPASYIASEFDGHPSALAHELAGRGLVNLMRQAPGFQRGRFAGDLEGVLTAALNDLVSQGVEADIALAWAADALAAKQRAARRLPGQAGRDLATGAEPLAAKIRQAAEKWRVLRRLDMRLPPATALVPLLVQLYVLVRNLDELVFILAETPEAQSLEEFGRLFSTGWYSQSERLAFFDGDVAAQVAAARAALQQLPALRVLHSLAVENAAGGWHALLTNADLTLASYGRELSRLGEFIARLDRQLDRLSRAAAQHRDDLRDPDVLRLWAVAFENVGNVLYYLRNCEEIFSPGPALDAPVLGRWTSLDVIIECDPDPAVAGTHYALVTEAAYKVPRRMSIRESNWGGVWKDRVAHHFEIPALLHGDLRIGVSNDEPTRLRFLRGTTRIAEIKIYSGAPGDSPPPQPAIEWRNPGDNLAAVDFKDIMLP